YGAYAQIALGRGGAGTLQSLYHGRYADLVQAVPGPEARLGRANEDQALHIDHVADLETRLLQPFTYLLGKGQVFRIRGDFRRLGLRLETKDPLELGEVPCAHQGQRLRLGREVEERA